MDKELIIMHEKVTDIQNSFWKAYKDFLETGDMGQANKDIDQILNKYQNDGVLLAACQWLSGAWSIVNNEVNKIRKNSGESDTGRTTK